MNNLDAHIIDYLAHCEFQKRLDSKTLKAYQIDLRQFSELIGTSNLSAISSSELEAYISKLHLLYKPKTVKRKIATTKAFFHYLEYKEIITLNPFNKIQIKFREPAILPKTIPLQTVESILSTIYAYRIQAPTAYQRQNALRDAAIIELLFATGIRISELCSLKTSDVNLGDRSLLIYGKGSKERRMQIGNDDVLRLLMEYCHIFHNAETPCEFFFINQNKTPVSDQTVRRMINKYTSLAAINLHITPHMFRHTFATSLLEADVDIRYIQEMLGHSSINVTEIYTHVALSKQRDILTAKHPRKFFQFEHI